jgi:hypothetical protein
MLRLNTEIESMQAVTNRFKRIQFTSFSPLEKIGKVANIHHQPKERKTKTLVM